MSLRQSAVVFTAMHRALNEINAINLIVMDEARKKDVFRVFFFWIKSQYEM